MSDQVRPTDVYAIARLDWCRPTHAPEGGAVAQVLCNIQARQCGSFTNATRDPQRIARTAPQLQQLLRAPEIQRWEGKCPRAEISGVCGLGGAKAFASQLWQGLGEPREREAYAVISGATPASAESQAQDLSQGVLLRPKQRDKLAPPGPSTARLLGLPFL